MSSVVPFGPLARTERPADPGRPLRLCFVSADFPAPATESEGIGGIGAHAHSLARAVAALGHEVVVVTEGAGAAERYRHGPLEVRALARRSPRLWKLGRWVPVPWIRRSLAAWRAVEALHRERPLDFVRFPDGYGEGLRFSFTPLAPFAVHLHGPASVVQDWDGRRRPKVRARVEAWLERWPASRASVVVTATRGFADRMASAWTLDRSRIRIIRNPLDVEHFSPGPAAVPSGPPTILFVGHLQWLKGLSTLAAAIPRVVARHPDARFELVGNDTASAPDGGSMRRYLEGILAASGVGTAGGAGDRVAFLGPMSQADLVARYRACAGLVLPSFHEVYGNVVLEAMACGRPCVVTSSIGAAELITPGATGLVVPPRDPEALAGALSELLAMPAAARDEMGARARRAVTQACARPVIAAQTIEAYREAMERPVAGGATGKRA